MAETTNDTSSGMLNRTKIDFALRLGLSLPSQIVCLSGLAGNAVVFWFLCFGMKRNPVTVYILNLAFVDFTLLLCISAELLYALLLAIGAAIPPFMHALWLPLQLIFTVGYNNSLFLLTAISVERCLSVVYPLWYKCQRPKHLSCIACSLLWVLAIAVTFLEGSTCTAEDQAAMAPHCTAVIVFLSCLGFGVVYLIMILSSLVLVIQVKRSSQKRQPTRLYRAILLNVLVFLVATFPTRILNVLKYFQVIKLGLYARFSIYYAHMFLTAMNSSANPYIYFLVGWTKRRKSRHLLKGALHRVFKSDQEMPLWQNETLNSNVSTAAD
ncbi:mas-related G-protein coupled receptor member H-like [Ambystoma mexicanum]|uniref:mas-related G-protein coupled receptor member H-like n=1 Tax=Ambystoma mexicanum TaxID=8296 RepID=UPI0037E6FEAC